MHGMIGMLALAALMAANAAVGAEQCGSLLNAVGPYDYRTASQAKRDLVEHFHFTEGVETLTAGQSSVGIAADIAYTLRAFPNHPRALLAMAKLAQRQHSERPRGSAYTVSCWFDRAIRFRPDDGNVRLVFGVALMKGGQIAQAIEQLNMADKLLPRNANVHYNLGLAYFDTKDFDKSLEHAKLAYELGFPLPGLRQKLERAGHWR